MPPSTIKGNFLRTKHRIGWNLLWGVPDEDKGHSIGSGAQCGPDTGCLTGHLVCYIVGMHS